MTDDRLLLAYYGDDLTGSTDVLEALSLNGVETALFLEPPEPGDLEAFDPDVRAVGIAGRSRSMTPAEMDEELPPAFEALAAFDPAVIQYKVCSTFDSSPTTGSIGHAIDLGQATVDSPFVPVVVAAPSLDPRGRYVVFGNLFATSGGVTYRIDRHPTMRTHPVTPMTEADLRRHLREQTDRDVEGLEVTALEEVPGTQPGTALDRLRDEAEIVLFDGLTHDHQATVGRLVWERVPDERPLLSASSAGLTYALAAHWRSRGIVEAPADPPPIPPADRVVVMAGSASPVTAAQIEWALAHGFEGIRLESPRLIDPSEADAARTDAVTAAVDALDGGRSVVLYSAVGPEDPAIRETRERAAALEIDDEDMSRRLGVEQGRILRTAIERTGTRRACIAGGDTSGFVAPELGIYALEFLAPTAPGSPLCRAQSRRPGCDGLEIVLKGGQVETSSVEPDLFGLVRDGSG